MKNTFLAMVLLLIALTAQSTGYAENKPKPAVKEVTKKMIYKLVKKSKKCRSVLNLVYLKKTNEIITGLPFFSLKSMPSNKAQIIKSYKIVKKICT